jgi:digeranylgeranylglycerophospholipid reductase
VNTISTDIDIHTRHIQCQPGEPGMEVLEHDVAVIGGGPAGATAARYAALEGVSTVLVERRKRPGIPVQCGEFLPVAAICKEMMPEAKELDHLLSPALDTLSMRTKEIKFFSPSGREYTIQFDGFTVDRDRFDAKLVDMARRAGADVMAGTAVRKIESANGHEVLRTSNGKELRAKVVIGADGPHSLVRKVLGLPGPKRLSPCIQWTVKGDHPPVVEMHFGNVAPWGYAWVIPKKGSVNIGLGVTGSINGSISALLKDFVERKGFDGKEGLLRKTGGHVPSTGPVPVTVSGRYLLAGDAAGHVMATNGGGIPTAMVGGRAAGTSAARHIASRMPLEAYEKAWKLEMGTMLRNAARTRAIAGLAFGSDWRLEMSMRLMGLGGMRRAVTCKKPFVLF